MKELEHLIQFDCPQPFNVDLDERECEGTTGYKAPVEPDQIVDVIPQNINSPEIDYDLKGAVTASSASALYKSPDPQTS